MDKRGKTQEGNRREETQHSTQSKKALHHGLKIQSHRGQVTLQKSEEMVIKDDDRAASKQNYSKFGVSTQGFSSAESATFVKSYSRRTNQQRPVFEASSDEQSFTVDRV